jgi:hypothetical protein
MAGLIYDTVNSTLARSKEQQLLKEKYGKLFDALESAVRSVHDRPADLEDFTFEKL